MLGELLLQCEDNYFPEEGNESLGYDSKGYKQGAILLKEGLLRNILLLYYLSVCLFMCVKE